MGATSQAGVMTIEWTSNTMSALSAFFLSCSRRNRPTQQKHNHPAKSLAMKATSLCEYLIVIFCTPVELNLKRFSLCHTIFKDHSNHYKKRFKSLKIVYTIHDYPCDAHCATLHYTEFGLQLSASSRPC